MKQRKETSKNIKMNLTDETDKKNLLESNWYDAHAYAPVIFLFSL